MPYVPHTLLQFRGSLGLAGTVSDMWSFSLRFRTAGTGAGSSVPQANVDKALNAAVTLIQNTNVPFSTAVTLEEVRGYVIGEDGRMRSDGVPRVARVTSTCRGTGSTNLHPWSVSNVVTLDAGGGRRGRFGRFYLPPQSFTVDADGRMTGAFHTNIATIAVAFVNSIQGATTGGEDLQLVVASQYGTNRDVNALRVGRVPDTQRRRDNRLSEMFSAPLALAS